MSPQPFIFILKFLNAMKNEKKRIIQQLMELEEEDRKNNPDYNYDSDDYY